MKKMFSLCLVFLLVVVFTASAQNGGFRGPRSSNHLLGIRPEPALVSVEDLRNFQDDARVKLIGNITEEVGDEEYTFKDSTGEVVIEIDRKIWGLLIITENDEVEIIGEVDLERGRHGERLEIDVKSIRKL